MVWYYKKQWWDGAPYQKKVEPSEFQPSKPLFRVGWWVRFTDPQCIDPHGADGPGAMEFVGKIRWATYHEGKIRYEIQCGYTSHNVAERRVQCRVVDVE